MADGSTLSGQLMFLISKNKGLEECDIYTSDLHTHLQQRHICQQRPELFPQPPTPSGFCPSASQNYLLVSVKHAESQTNVL